MGFVKEHKDVPVVVFYQEASGNHIWWLSDELMEYPRVYLAGTGNKEAIAEEEITGSDSLVVYVADREIGDECLLVLVAVIIYLISFAVVAEKGRGVWMLYELR